MIGKRYHSHKGMTLLEVTVSIGILGMLLLPIASYFNSATKMRADAQSVSAATINAENLIKDIKEQIAKDVLVQRDNETKGLSNPVEPYVSKSTGLVSEADAMTASERVNTLTKFFGIDSIPAEVDRFNTVYKTDKYSYEVAIWKMDKKFQTYLSSLGGVANWSSGFLDRAYQLNSDDEFKFMNTDFSKYPSITADNTRFEVSTGLFDTDFIGKEKYFDEQYTGKITLLQDGTIDDSTGATTLTCTEVYDKFFDVDVGTGTGNRTILIDATKFTSSGTPEKAIALRIKNSGASEHLTVQIRKNKTMTDEEVDSKLIITSDSKNDIVIDRPTDIEVENNYLIALVIRDKKPSMGNKGKIVKRMVEVYSYDHPKE